MPAISEMGARPGRPLDGMTGQRRDLSTERGNATSELSTAWHHYREPAKWPLSKLHRRNASSLSETKSF